MYLTQYFLFCIILLLALGAVIAFSFFVVKPMQTRWAIVKAHKILESGIVRDDRHFRNVYRILATAPNDLEAAKLWRKLDRMMALEEKPEDDRHIQYVGIIPPRGKF